MAGKILTQSQISIATPGGDGTEPSFRSGVDTAIFSDSFEAYSNADQIKADSPYWSDYIGDVSIVQGSGGAGTKAVRIQWPQWTEQSTSVLIAEGTLSGPPWYVMKFKVRFKPGVVMTGAGMKFIEPWPGEVFPANRCTFGVTDLSGNDGPPGHGQTGSDLGVHDNNWPDGPVNIDPFCYNLSDGGRFRDMNEGNWHTITWRHKWAGSAASKGIELWTDGTKRLSTIQGAPGVPSNFYQPDRHLNIIKIGDIVVSAPNPNTGTYWFEVDDFELYEVGA